MLKRNHSQLDFFTLEIHNKLVPKDHLLVQIDSFIDFEFLYDKLSSSYSDVGRGSKDPVMMVKIMLLEYIYGHSDVKMEKAIQTDIAIRWFLRLSIDEKGPDASTISYFRIHRMTEEDTQYFFNEIDKLGIERGVVKTQRFIVDTTDVAANVNYPSEHRLLYSAYKNLIKQIEKHDVITAINLKSDLDDAFEALNEYESKYSTKDLAHVF